ncbi:MAG: hypothetical protein ABXS93_04495 [Sulfurimonas sp.]
MFKQILFVLIASLFFIGCSSDNQHKIKIATNSWIGYAPLFYAYETGELKKLNIELITNVSLAEASEIFEMGKADLVTTTQHEYLSLKKSITDITPVILIDRSDGGDMIMSNKTIDELNASKTIYTYLEIDSINSELLKSFLKKYRFKDKEFVHINKDQFQISALKNEAKSMLIVTYSPYNTQLATNGFKELASTGDIDTLIVIDALCARRSLLDSDKERLKQLKIVIDQAIEKIQKDPKKVYGVIKKYLGNITYDEYKSSLKLIKWINKNPSKRLLKNIRELGYDKGVIIQ